MSVLTILAWCAGTVTSVWLAIALYVNGSYYGSVWEQLDKLRGYRMEQMPMLVPGIICLVSWLIVWLNYE